MNRAWTLIKSHPYISNMVGYTALFATADLIQQGLTRKSHHNQVLPNKGAEQHKPSNVGFSPDEEQTEDLLVHTIKRNLPDNKRENLVEASTDPHRNNWGQTARVALVGFCFHANFNYHWLRGLEKRFPGAGAKRVVFKVFLDQLFAAPLTISAFYIGLSTMEGAKDPLEDWRNKFWPSYQTGVVYWSAMQAMNFSLVPPAARTIFVGGAALVWTVFLCQFRTQNSTS